MKRQIFWVKKFLFFSYALQSLFQNKGMHLKVSKIKSYHCSLCMLPTLQKTQGGSRLEIFTFSGLCEHKLERQFGEFTTKGSSLGNFVSNATLRWGGGRRFKGLQHTEFDHTPSVLALIPVGWQKGLLLWNITHPLFDGSGVNMKLKVREVIGSVEWCYLLGYTLYMSEMER